MQQIISSETMLLVVSCSIIDIHYVKMNILGKSIFGVIEKGMNTSCLEFQVANN